MGSKKLDDVVWVNDHSFIIMKKQPFGSHMHMWYAKPEYGRWYNWSPHDSTKSGLHFGAKLTLRLKQ